MSLITTRRFQCLKCLTGCFAFLSIGAIGCGSSDSANVDGGSTGGAVAGEPDSHCSGKPTQSTSQASCMVTAPDGGAPEEENETMYNASGDDDDCKYHLSFTNTAVAKNSNVFITAVATRKDDGKPATGADIDIEALLNPTHPALTNDAKTVESPAGTYTIGPLKFDASGKWTVRFHLYENCYDGAEDSPHGHAAFFFNVP